MERYLIQPEIYNVSLKSTVMRIKENEVFSLFNISGEWEAKIIGISKSIVEFNVTKQLRQKENFKELCAGRISSCCWHERI